MQTRISNQNTNLITALLHRNVSLTNNHSERNIRCFVVARKISGGSRSKDGAKKILGTVGANVQVLSKNDIIKL
ncbi:MAG: transposase [Candidatus Aminicenantes bacterium]|nr:transposase [Candidatus Aminicenantes bacterium]